MKCLKVDIQNIEIELDISKFSKLLAHDQITRNR